jgi:hypothetical protein
MHVWFACVVCSVLLSKQPLCVEILEHAKLQQGACAQALSTVCLTVILHAVHEGSCVKIGDLDPL